MSVSFTPNFSFDRLRPLRAPVDEYLHRLPASTRLYHGALPELRELV
jgi:hypothetical protein